jgi:enamine deaminase RidA (YjgF/YER057c/UK114 family)
MGRQRLTAIGVVALAACAMPVGGASGGPMADPLRTEYLNSGLPNGIEGFSQVVRIGPSVYVSGQVALDGEGKVVGPGDLRAQATQAFENLTHCLRIAGATPAEAVRVNVFVVNLTEADWAVVRDVGARFFPQRKPPAGTVLGVASLPRDGLLIAVDAVAVVRAEYRPRE